MTHVERIVSKLQGQGRFAVIVMQRDESDVAKAIDAAYPEQRGRLGSEARIALTTFEGARLACDFCDVKPGHYDAIVHAGEPEVDEEPEIDF